MGTQHEGGPGQLPLPPDLLQGVGVPVDLYHFVGADAVHLPVGAAADDRAPGHAEAPEGFADLHKLREARHVEDLVDLRGDVDDLCRRDGLPDAQKQPQAGAGEEGQLLAVEHDGLRPELRPEPVQRPARLGGVGAGDGPLRLQGEDTPIHAVGHGKHPVTPLSRRASARISLLVRISLLLYRLFPPRSIRRRDKDGVPPPAAFCAARKRIFSCERQLKK